MTPTDPRCRLQFEKMERKKQAVLGLIRTLPADKYYKQPHPQSWSPAQVANHLFLSEKLSFAYIKKKMMYPDTIPPYHFKSWLSIYYLKLVFGSFIKTKAPPGINMWEQQPILLPDVLEKQWHELRDEMAAYFETTYPQFKNHLVYNHPFAGRLTMRQMLIFFNGHISHHICQLKRIIRELN